MKKTSLWIKMICMPFALALLVLALSGYPVLPIRDVGAFGDVAISAEGNTLSKIVFYVT